MQMILYIYINQVFTWTIGFLIWQGKKSWCIFIAINDRLQYFCYAKVRACGTCGYPTQTVEDSFSYSGPFQTSCYCRAELNWSN